ncbi:MAG: aminomethyl-transferring glycine dehydrogenase [Ichthyobacteriaceae bacterium]|nr:aminomethyl-transferring glycine dehydrogenase [Ichthyobacteriaceae bacterium]
MRTGKFLHRHVGSMNDGVQKMLDTVGVNTLDELINETLPDNIRLKNILNLPEALTEVEYMGHIQELARKNKVYKTYIGLGYNASTLPGVIQRNIFENPGWYTAYTPYQAEIAQGRLEALLNYQTMITDLTGMDLANSSLLDEATAAAEAMGMLFSSRSRTKKKLNANKFFVSEELFPQTIDVIKTRATPIGIELVFGNHNNIELTDEFFGAIIQYPAKNGGVYNYTDFVKKASLIDVKVAVAADLLSLAILTPPAEWGADVVVGTTQRFGLPLGYGGPHSGYFATKEEYKRHIPGRIIGVSKDADGNTALRMALQTREQHIKREKATSNICTAQVLLAVMSGMYGVYHGASGLKHIANTIHNLAKTLEKGIERLGFKQVNEFYFDTLVVDLGQDLHPSGITIEPVKRIAEEKEVNFLYIDDTKIGISLNETTSLNDINDILDVLAESKHVECAKLYSVDDSENKIQKELVRTSSFMTNPVFDAYHSETEMMRYIKRLEKKDLSLNHSMIALGSCTMKLNAATEMLPLSWPSWGNIHPFVPRSQAAGYHELFRKLESYLSEITGFSATTLQPNSGAQGEYAGLMVIREHFKYIGEEHRNIALIPASAHGTNPASAVMAGMKVVVIKTTEKGDIDIEDLKLQTEKHKDNLACLLVTYPSTHGVYESAIKDITKMIHDNGGQVYMDGANMNAQVGLTSPGEIGADVCHLNLHKTFAIPHGGGGPGVGPIGVAEHLAQFLPSNPVVATGGKNAVSAISAAPWGSALVHSVSYSYIRMLGEEGLKHSTKMAILNANYMKTKLAEDFNILYTGNADRVAHEMILDTRNFKEYGIEVTDIAKRLMDYGYHAPTVSFPVAGTLMIEPTESESVEELDRFIEAMVSIKKEILDIAEGKSDKQNNMLKNAPHTLEMLTADNWDLPYSRKQAAYPLNWIADNKFWPSVRRVDDAYGDRNLVCTCAPIEDYIDDNNKFDFSK